MTYAIARIPTPMFNTPDVPFAHLPLKKDNQGRLMEMETIAFPGTKFKCLNEISETIVQVETAEYKGEFFVDQRFLKNASAEIPERKIELPTAAKILEWMEEKQGLRYFWGGNWDAGIPEILKFYPQMQQASLQDKDDAICKGLDCSGLLYQATNGFTPRNTSDLVNFGEDLHLQTLEEVQAHVKPLDLFVWKGHVIIVRSPTTFIESRIKDGVVITNLENRFFEVVKMLKEQNKQFFFRRWCQSALQ